MKPFSFSKKQLVILAQFFLIIFVYHTLKDLKDTIVITGSGAGAEVIPFIKIWGMLPVTIGVSFLFTKIYQRFGREKTLCFFVLSLLSVYLIFAYLLYPLRETLYLGRCSASLSHILPAGCRGLIAMVCFWHYTFFYITAELWSLLILTILFWGYLNESMTLTEAKKFYPLCMFAGNFAGILSGQLSFFLCHHLQAWLTWQTMLQSIILLVALCCGLILVTNRWLSNNTIVVRSVKDKVKSPPFLDNLYAIFRSGPLLCIALLVVGFGLTCNLIEVIWKEKIRHLYPLPQDYNAYINRLTSFIGISAVCMALVSRWIFQKLTWCGVALLTPATLFVTTLCFFCALVTPPSFLIPLLAKVHLTPLQVIVTLGAIHYVLSLTAKYTIFDTTKEMAFFSISAEERMGAKAVIDSIGSRLGKSGASCLYQFCLILFGSTLSHLSLIGFIAVIAIGISLITTKKLGGFLAQTQKNIEEEAQSKTGLNSTALLKVENLNRL